jgi:hypothetical protein
MPTTGTALEWWLAALLRSLHQRFCRPQHAFGRGEDLLGDLLLLREQVELLLNMCAQRLAQRFGRVAEILRCQAQRFGTLPLLLGLLAQQFGVTPLHFPPLAPLFSREELIRQLLTVLFGSPAMLFGGGAQLLGRVAHFFGYLALVLGGLWSIPIGLCRRLLPPSHSLALLLAGPYAGCLRHVPLPIP